MGIFSGFMRVRKEVSRTATAAVIAGEHVAEFLRLPHLAQQSDEWKNSITTDFHRRTMAVIGAASPFNALRKEIADWALWYADYQVLVMTAEQKGQSFYSECPFVSDTLQHHLHKCIEHHEVLREFWWNLKDSSHLRQEASLRDATFHYASICALVAQ